MALPRIRFSLLQLSLLVVLAAILVRAWVLFSRPSGRPIYSVTSLAFSPDGKTLAASLYVYHQVEERVWGLSGANASRSFFLVDLPDLSPARLVERDVQPGELGMDLFVQKSALGQSIAISPDGKTLATMGANRVSLWEVRSGRKIRDVSLNGGDGLAAVNAVFSVGLSGGLGCCGGLSWAGDGSLAVGGGDGAYVLRPGAATLEDFGLAQGCVAVALSRDGSELAPSDFSGINLFDARAGAPRARDPYIRTPRLELYHAGPHAGNYAGFGLAISPDGKLVAAGIRVWDKSKAPVGWGEGVQVWEAATGKQRATFTFRDVYSDAPSIALAFSPDGSTLAVADNARGPQNQAIAPASGGSRLRLCSLNGAADATLPTNAPIASVAYSPNGSLLATGDFAGEVSLWDVRTKQLLKRVSFVPGRDWSWPILIAASVVWLVAWLYARRKRRRADANGDTAPG